MEGGDGDTSDSYAFAEESLARETRSCAYDRANLGQSDPHRVRVAPTELVDDPRAAAPGRQQVVETGHAVQEDDPQLVLDLLRDVVHAAQ